jgi:hypothetical protein
LHSFEPLKVVETKAPALAAVTSSSVRTIVSIPYTPSKAIHFPTSPEVVVDEDVPVQSVDLYDVVVILLSLRVNIFDLENNDPVCKQVSRGSFTERVAGPVHFVDVLYVLEAANLECTVAPQSSSTSMMIP